MIWVYHQNDAPVAPKKNAPHISLSRGSRAQNAPHAERQDSPTWLVQAVENTGGEKSEMSLNALSGRYERQNVQSKI